MGAIFILFGLFLSQSIQASTLAAGASHSCAFQSDQLFCWGWNDRGQLGNGTRYDALSAKRVAIDAPSGSHIAIGGSHSCLVTLGQLYCWGKNMTSQLGTGNRTDYSTPQKIQLPGLATHASAGLSHTCAVVEGGVMCWGSDWACQVGQEKCERLGDGRAIVTTPHFVEELGPESGVTFVAAGYQNSCGIVNGGVKCWGQSIFGSLGDNRERKDYQPTPVQVHGIPEGSGATQVTIGIWHSCALVRGEVKCWGHEQMVGDQRKEGEHAFTPVVPLGLKGKIFQSISTHRHTTCGVSEGKVFCWGDGKFGQLGDGRENSYSETPTELTDLSAFATEVAVGDGHVCVRTIHSEIYCWGLNANGQVGAGTGQSPIFNPQPVN